MTSQMNIYEFMILLAHIDATREQMLRAGHEAAKALERGSITHNNTAIDFMASIEATLVLGHELMNQLNNLPTEWIMRGIPQGSFRNEAKDKVKQRWLYLSSDDIDYKPHLFIKP